MASVETALLRIPPKHPLADLGLRTTVVHARVTMRERSDRATAEAHVREEADAALPVKVQRLAPREREVATLVYGNGPLTANAVLAQVSGKVGNAAVRSMLRRLVAKGIVNRRKDGGVKAFEYCPAITNAVSTQAAIRRLAEDHFEGSIASVARAVLDLVARYDKPLPHDLEWRTGA